MLLVLLLLQGGCKAAGCRAWAPQRQAGDARPVKCWCWWLRPVLLLLQSVQRRAGPAQLQGVETSSSCSGAKVHHAVLRLLLLPGAFGVAARRQAALRGALALLLLRWC
jgi:hypothetical protein